MSVVTHAAPAAHKAPIVSLEKSIARVYAFSGSAAAYSGHSARNTANPTLAIATALTHPATSPAIRRFVAVMSYPVPVTALRRERYLADPGCARRAVTA